MRRDKLSLLLRIVLHANLSLMQTGARKNKRIRQLRNRAKPLRVRNSLNLVHKLEVHEIVHENLLFDDDDNSVAAEANGAHGGAKREFADAATLVVVPDHDFIGRVLWVGTTADESEDVTSEEHLDVADSSAVEFSAEEFAEGVAVVDPEAVIGGGGEAGVVLIE